MEYRGDDCEIISLIISKLRAVEELSRTGSRNGVNIDGSSSSPFELPRDIRLLRINSKLGREGVRGWRGEDT